MSLDLYLECPHCKHAEHRTLNMVPLAMEAAMNDGADGAETSARIYQLITPAVAARDGESIRRLEDECRELRELLAKAGDEREDALERVASPSRVNREWPGEASR